MFQTSAILPLIEPVGLVVVLVYFAGSLTRWLNGPVQRQMALGILFGAGTMIAMNMPINLAEGVIIDMRALFIGVTWALLGPLAGVIASVMGAAMRLYIGGAGAPSGVVAILLAAVGGMIWYQLVRPYVTRRTVSLALLGACISIHNFAVFLVDQTLWVSIFTEITPILIVMNIIGAVIFGHLLDREASLDEMLHALKEEASTDPLTQLMNRRALLRKTDELRTTHAPNRGRAVLYFDIDHFKSINDAMGHEVGDAVLQNISQRVRNCLRPNDLFCRIGGDEFVIVLPDIEKFAAAQVAHRCLVSVKSRKVSVGDQKVPVSISIGATWSNEELDVERQITTADRALYESKSNGRSRVTLDSAFGDLSGLPFNDGLTAVA